MWNSPLMSYSVASRRVVLDSEQSDVDIWQLLGQIAVPVFVIVEIQPTAVIETLTTGALAVGSRVRMQQNGYILGAGGRGGTGGDPGGGGDPAIPGGNGVAGGPALTLTVETELNMTAGYIWGAGGGGGGSQIGHGGSGGVSGGPGGFAGSQSAGNPATSGIGAVPGAAVGQAGAGGSWGESGQAASGVGAGSGGNAGSAIQTNGNTLIYLGDDEATLKAGGFIIGEVV